nr:hypothetical protein [Tanacetum cinerariifolium]
VIGTVYRYKKFIMDANEIRLLLRDQATANHRQAEMFQAQFEALQAELKVTKEMIQAARHRGGGGDNLALTLPRSVRLNVPKFSGADPDSWLFLITDFLHC